MIALRDSLPLVRGIQGNAFSFQAMWLRVVLQDAAARAGYNHWEPLDDFVAGIALYLRNCYARNVIDLPELEGVIRDALRDVGYNEVAACFSAVSPSREMPAVDLNDYL